jgi:N-acetylglucosamine-6-sulfatase
MGFDKRQLYETDIRVPYIVFGPGITAGSVASQPVSHVDLVRSVRGL